MNTRVKHHATLAALAAITLGIAAFGGAPMAAADRLSIVSAYLCLFLLGTALLIGPYHTIRHGRPVANSYLRRDIGIWGALTGLLHFFLANMLAMTYEYLDSFVENAPLPPSEASRFALYTAGTILGYLIALIFLLLLSLSNDRMMRITGHKWWKRLQRASYFAFVFTCLHAFAFQVLETRAALWIAVVLFVFVAILAGQSRGVAAVRRLRAKEGAN
ncbi:MAG: hypothetical protein QNJ73_16285 [Gammaproteobacteria bacterium]|nr:hypothetical protein [Gammaproteobacteria bacterium]